MRKQILFSLLIVLLLVAVQHASAQYYHLENLSTKNVLPDNSIQDIFKDADGTIWLGTNGGLCKYNGEDVKIYTTRDGLPRNWVWGITQDKRGMLWLATYGGGVCSFDGKKFHTLTLSDTISKHFRVANYSFKYDCLLFGSSHGLYVKAPDTSLYFDGGSVGIKRFQVIAIHKVGEEFFIYTYNKAPTYIFNPANNTIRKYGKYKSRNIDNIASAIINNGDTIIGYNRDNTIILKKGRNVKFDNTGQIFDMCKGNNNSVWLAGWDISLSGNSGGLFQIRNDSLFDFTQKFNIPTRMFWSLYFDSMQQVLFVGTNDNGLYIYRNSNFEYFDLQHGELKISSMKWLDDKLWIGDRNYLLSLDKNGDIQSFDKDYFRKKIPKNQYTKKISKYYSSPTTQLNIEYINTDSMGHLWCSSEGGLFQNTGAEFRFERYSRLPFYISRRFIYEVGWSQLYKYDRISKETGIFNYRKDHTPIDIRKIVKHNDIVWFLSWNRGLFALKNGKYLHFYNKHGLTANDIKDISFDSEDRMYIAQNNGELLIANFEGDSLHVLQKLSCNKEIHGNILNWLICNKHDQLFVGTNFGLNYINLSKADSLWQFRLYNEKEGYLAKESTTAVLDNEDNIWVNTQKGVLKIKPDDFDKTMNYPEVRITGMEIYNAKADSLLDVSHPKLSYDENYLNFYFSRNNYLNADKDEYWYRLKPLSNQWIKANGKSVSFYNLQPGKYHFEVRCYNTNSGEMSKSASFSFKVRTPWWKSAWFIVSALIVFITVVLLIAKRRIKSIKAQAQEENRINKKIAELEMKALQSQMNPHFVFNSLNAIQNFVLDGNIDETLNYIGHFSKLLRNTLNYSTKQYISIEQEREFLKNYIALEQMRFKKDDRIAFGYEFIVDADVNQEVDILPPMLLQPIIENAIKHGEVHKVPNGIIVVEISIENNQLVCRITDNGVGRTKSAQKQNKNHRSKGISIIDDRIKILSKNIHSGMKIVDLERGTMVVLYIALRVN